MGIEGECRRRDPAKKRRVRVAETVGAAGFLLDRARRPVQHADSRPSAIRFGRCFRRQQNSSAGLERHLALGVPPDDRAVGGAFLFEQVGAVLLSRSVESSRIAFSLYKSSISESP
mgnify:CR=1 FL=1